MTSDCGSGARAVRGQRLQQGCGASGLRVGLGRTRPRVVWWVPGRGGQPGPMLALLSTRQVVWASPRVPRLVCSLGSTARASGPLGLRWAPNLARLLAVLQRPPCARCWWGLVSEGQIAPLRLRYLTLLAPKKGFPKGL